MPIQYYLEMAVGYLRWKPSDFWNSTPWEFNVALKGYFDAEAAKVGNTSTERITKNDLFNLRDKCRDIRKTNGNT